ncbi:MAG: HU family DNA-binding protein [Acidobacteriota bacterium]
MTKADLVERVSEAAGISKSEAEAVVNTVLNSIVDALRLGEKIELRGFGSFRLRMRRGRLGRNPKTGTKVDVPGKAVSYFKPGKELRELLNPGETFVDDDDLDEDTSVTGSEDGVSSGGKP